MPGAKQGVTWKAQPLDLQNKTNLVHRNLVEVHSLLNTVQNLIMDNHWRIRLEPSEPAEPRVFCKTSIAIICRKSLLLGSGNVHCTALHRFEEIIGSLVKTRVTDSGGQSVVEQVPKLVPTPETTTETTTTPCIWRMKATKLLSRGSLEWRCFSPSWRRVPGQLAWSVSLGVEMQTLQTISQPLEASWRFEFTVWNDPKKLG